MCPYLTHVKTSWPGRAPTHAAIAHAVRQQVCTTHMKPTSDVPSRKTCSSMSNVNLGALSRRCHAESAMLSSRSATRVAIEAACSACVFWPLLMLPSSAGGPELGLTWLTVCSMILERTAAAVADAVQDCEHEGTRSLLANALINFDETWSWTVSQRRAARVIPSKVARGTFVADQRRGGREHGISW